MFGRTRLAACGLITVLGFATSSHADPSWHYGIGFGFSDVESFNDGNDTEGSFGSLELLVGATDLFAIAPNFGVEAQLSLSADDTLDPVFESSRTCGINANGLNQCGADTLLRLRATYNFQINKRLDLNFAAGPVWVEASRATSTTETTRDSYTGMSSGLGLTYHFEDHRIRLMLNQDDYGGAAGRPNDLEAEENSAELFYIRSF